MRKHKIEDERVLTIKSNIGNNAFKILFLGLFLTALLKEYIFRVPFEQYVSEYILLLVVGAYVIIKNIIAGIDVFTPVKNSQMMVIVFSLVGGFIGAFINTTYNHIKYHDYLIADSKNTLLVSGATFIILTVIIFLVLEVIFIANKKRQKHINSFLENNEEEGI